MISSIKARIEEVEKGCRHSFGEFNRNKNICGKKGKYCIICRDKLDIYQSCLALAEKDKEDKIKMINTFKYELLDEVNESFEELKTSLFENGDKK